MVIEKKVVPPYFESILSGNKKFELRLADFECNPGDTLLLREWDPNNKLYTGREILKNVTYVWKWKLEDLFWSEEEIRKYGLQVISIV